MSTRELPKGWTKVPLGAICLPIVRAEPKTIHKKQFIYIDIGSIEATSRSIVSPQVLSVDDAPSRARQIVRAHDVLFSTVRPYLRNIAYVSEQFDNHFASTGFSVIRAADGIEPRYLFHLVNWNGFIGKVLPFQRGSSYPAVRDEDVKSITVPVPPKREQKRIVAKIDELFARLNAAETDLKKSTLMLGAQRRSVLNAAFCGALTEDWRAAGTSSLPACELLERILDRRKVNWSNGRRGRSYKEPFTPDTSVLPALPKSWCWVSVDQIASGHHASLTDGPFGSNLKTEHYTSAGPRVVRLENIGDSVFNDSHAHISLAHFQRLKRHEVFRGDVLIASLGEELPRACLVPESLGLAIVKADCVRLHPSELLPRTEWVMFALNSPVVRNLAKRFIHGVGRPRLSLKFTRQLPIPLAPEDEQKEILNRIEKQLIQIEATARCLDEQISHVQVLKQSILAAAFRGELVPQDASDEPAERLLERLPAQRIVESAPVRVRNGKRKVPA